MRVNRLQTASHDSRSISIRLIEKMQVMMITDDANAKDSNETIEIEDSIVDQFQQKNIFWYRYRISTNER